MMHAPPPVIHELRHVSTRAPLVVKLSHPASAFGVGMRAHAASCNKRHPLRIVVTVDKRKTLSARLSSPKFRALQADRPIKAGTHKLRVSVSGGKRRCNAATIDELRLLLSATPGGTPLGPKRRIPLATAFTSAPAERVGASGNLFRTSFDGLTPENAMKMTYVEVAKDKYLFDTPDAIVDYARSMGKSVHGHPLVWETQLPGWLTRGKWSSDELKVILRNWITTMVSHYKGRVSEWDVVNEPLADDGTLKPSIWTKIIGPEYIALALRWAREADPDAKLFINEYDDELPGPKHDALLKLAKSLRADGVPLDGIGIQAHWSLLQPPVDEHSLLASVRSFAAAGLQVQFTEADVITDGTAFEQIAQADEFAKAARVCQSVSACTRFTVWGLDDNVSWRGVGSAATLFDRNYTPKPAFTAVRAALDAG